MIGRSSWRIATTSEVFLVWPEDEDVDDPILRVDMVAVADALLLLLLLRVWSEECPGMLPEKSGCWFDFHVVQVLTKVKKIITLNLKNR